MYTIFEQGKQKGIGHGYESFLRKFISICESHLENDRAKSFAFLLYDFHNHEIREILKSQGGFAKLDRLSGKELSIFYIHTDNKKLIKSFNRVFIGAFEIENIAELPYVLFFKVADGDVKDVEIVELEQSNMMFAFQELYTTIEEYIENSEKLSKPKKNKFVKTFKKVKTMSVNQFIGWVIQEGLEHAKEVYR